MVRKLKMLFTQKYGTWWTSDGINTTNKFEALLYASKKKVNVKFLYHHNVWKDFDRKLLGKETVNSLFAQRAQQLREKYDYLILYYSGGADSHNILRTFIDNNIKLDEVCVKWPESLLKGKTYNPNADNKDASNFWSEWDFAIKPSLDWLSKEHPEIKITVKDYIAGINKVHVGSLFEQMNMVRSVSMFNNSTVSDSEREYLDKGKTVGNIYGIDKPLLHLNKKNEVYMFFTDVSLDQVGKSLDNPEGAECFYWSYDFPILAFEQANQLSKYYEANPDKRKFMWRPGEISKEERILINQFQQRLGRAFLYTTWDNRFQTDKPVAENRKDKFYWFYDNEEFNTVRKNYLGNLVDRVNMLDDSMLTGAPGDEERAYKIISSPLYYVTTLSDPLIK